MLSRLQQRMNEIASLMALEALNGARAEAELEAAIIAEEMAGPSPRERVLPEERVRKARTAAEGAASTMRRLREKLFALAEQERRLLEAEADTTSHDVDD